MWQKRYVKNLFLNIAFCKEKLKLKYRYKYNSDTKNIYIKI